LLAALASPATPDNRLDIQGNTASGGMLISFGKP
jgi:hypothetical protein